jgi:hypothetical protein
MYCIMYGTVFLYCLLCLQTDCQNEGNIISFGHLILRTVRSVCMQLYCDVLRIRPGVASYTEMTNARCLVIYDIYAGTVCSVQHKVRVSRAAWNQACQNVQNAVEAIPLLQVPTDSLG